MPDRFRSGDAPKVFVYIDKHFVWNLWLESHMTDISKNRCPLPCSYTIDRTQAGDDGVVSQLFGWLSRVISQEVIIKYSYLLCLLFSCINNVMTGDD